MLHVMSLHNYTVLLAQLTAGFPDVDPRRCLHCYGAGRRNDGLIAHGRPVIELLEQSLPPDKIEAIYKKSGYGDPRQFPHKCISLSSFLDALVEVIQVQ